MFVEDVIMEASITNGKTGELSGVSVWVSAALYRCWDQTKLKKLFVEESSVSAEVTNQVADFSSDAGIFVQN